MIFTFFEGCASLTGLLVVDRGCCLSLVGGVLVAGWDGGARRPGGGGVTLWPSRWLLGGLGGVSCPEEAGRSDDFEAVRGCRTLPRYGKGCSFGQHSHGAGSSPCTDVAGGVGHR